jgi:transcriptional regulator with XRE-family HTH domain
MEVCERVKLARMFAGLSADQLAKRLNLTRVNVMRWESKDGGPPKKQLRQLAEATGFPEGFFCGEELKGLVVARPGRFISNNARGRAYDYVHKELPRLVADADCVEVASDHYVATLFNGGSFCLVIIPADKMAFASEKCSESIWTSDDMMKEAFELNSGVLNLLKAAGCEQFSLGQKKRIFTIKIETDDERSVMNIIITALEELRRAGHEAHFV